MPFSAAIAELKTLALSGAPSRSRRFFDETIALKDGRVERALLPENLTCERSGRNDTLL